MAASSLVRPYFINVTYFFLCLYRTRAHHSAHASRAMQRARDCRILREDEVEDCLIEVENCLAEPDSSVHTHTSCSDDNSSEHDDDFVAKLDDLVSNSSEHDDDSFAKLDYFKDFRPFMMFHKEKDTSPFFFPITSTQRREIEAIDFDMDERKKKIGMFLKLNMRDVCDFFNLDLSPLKLHVQSDDPMSKLKEDNFSYILEYFLFRCMIPLMSVDDIVWVALKVCREKETPSLQRDSIIMVPVWTCVYTQLKEEGLNDFLIDDKKNDQPRYHFLRGALHRIVVTINDFKYPEVDGVIGHIPYFYSSTDPDMSKTWWRDPYESAIIKKWSLMPVLSEIKKKGKTLVVDDWWGLMHILSADVPQCHFLKDKASQRAWLFLFFRMANNDISPKDRQRYLGDQFFSIYTKLTILRLTYTDKVVCFRTIPTCISRINMQWSDFQGKKSLFFFLVKHLIGQCGVSLFFFYIISHLPQTIAEDMQDLIMKTFTECLKTYSISVRDRVTFHDNHWSKKYIRKVFKQDDIQTHYTKEYFHKKAKGLELFCANIYYEDTGCTCFPIEAILTLLRYTSFLKMPYVQKAMLDMAKYIFRHGEIYLNLPIENESLSAFREANLRTAKIVYEKKFKVVDGDRFPGYDEFKIEMNNYAKLHSKHVNYTLSKEKMPLVQDVMIDGYGMTIGLGDKNSTPLRNVLGTLRSNIPKKSDVFDFLESESACFERFIKASVLYYCTEVENQSSNNFTVKCEEISNTLVFLDKRRVLPGKGILSCSVFRKLPWVFKGSMPSKLQKYRSLAVQYDNCLFKSKKGECPFYVRDMLQEEKRTLEEEICILKKDPMAYQFFIHSSVSYIPTLNKEYEIYGTGRVSVNISWEPFSSDVLNLFGSKITPLDRNYHPYEMWSYECVAYRNGPLWHTSFPKACSSCKFSFSFSSKIFQDEEGLYHCTACYEIYNTTQHLPEEYAIICGVEGDETGRFLWSNSNNAVRFDSQHKSIRSLKALSRRKLFDKEKENQNAAFLNGELSLAQQYALRSKRLKTLGGRFSTSNNSGTAFFGASETDKKWLDRIFGDVSVPKIRKIDHKWQNVKFLCCEKKDISKISVPFEHHIFKKALEIIGISEEKLGRPLTTEDQKKLKNDACFLKVYYTLFSTKGRERSLDEAVCWKESLDERPSHCMFYSEEFLLYDDILRHCLKVIQ